MAFQDKLLAVGGRDKKNTRELSNRIFTFDESSKQWVQSYMPLALDEPAVIGYQSYLIVAGGFNSMFKWDANVNILDMASNKWISAQPLPRRNRYRPMVIQDTLYLLSTHGDLLGTHIPSLIQGKSDVWASLSKAPLNYLSPVSIGNNLIAVCGSEGDELFSRGMHINSQPGIHLYSPDDDQWINVCDLPSQRKKCCCAVVSGELIIVGTTETVTAVDCAYPVFK